MKRMGMSKAIKSFSDVVLERRFFAVNSAGDNEFDWMLTEFGYSKEEASKIDAVTIQGEVVDQDEF